MNSTDTLPALPASAETPTPRRRNREELEQLAAEFVNSGIHVRPRRPRRVPKAAFAAGGVAAIALVAWLSWPQGVGEPVRAAAPTVNEGEAWARRLEAERERQRVELQQSRDYLAKIAAADSALLGEMTARAQGLAARADAEGPVAARRATGQPQAGEPTPRTETPSTVAAQAPTTSSPMPSAEPAPTPARAEVVGSEPARAEPARAESARTEPAAAPTQVAAASCSIHVSELSASGTLTYADVARMKGARTDPATGHVLTPPVAAGNGRTVAFEVMPNGCVRIARQLAR